MVAGFTGEGTRAEIFREQPVTIENEKASAIMSANSIRALRPALKPAWIGLRSTKTILYDYVFLFWEGFSVSDAARAAMRVCIFFLTLI